jgi:hypothetical protein
MHAHYQLGSGERRDFIIGDENHASTRLLPADESDSRAVFTSAIKRSEGFRLSSVIAG